MIGLGELAKAVGEPHEPLFQMRESPTWAHSPRRTSRWDTNCDRASRIDDDGVDQLVPLYVLTPPEKSPAMHSRTPYAHRQCCSPDAVSHFNVVAGVA